MLRLLEVALFLAPFAVYLAWRRSAARGQPPSRRLVAAVAAGLVLYGAALAWVGLSDRLPPGARYVPPVLQDGRIVPGHGG